MAAAAPQLEGQLRKVRVGVARSSSVLKIKAVMSCRMIVFWDKKYFAVLIFTWLKEVERSRSVKITAVKSKVGTQILFVSPQLANPQILGLIPQSQISEVCQSANCKPANF